jgi:hypothetical protein
MKDFTNKEVYYIPKPITDIYKSGSFKDKKYSDRISHTASITVYSKKIYDDLIKHGVSERKTFTLTFPTWMPKNLLRHFIRGYFDGDGSVTLSDQRPRYIFYGQPDFLKNISDVLIEDLQVNNTKIFNKDTVSMLAYSSKKDISNIFRYFYDDANYFLTRKKNKILPYINTEVSR